MNPIIQIIFIASMTYIIGTLGYWLSTFKRWLLFMPSLVFFFAPFPFIVWILSQTDMSEENQQFYLALGTSVIVASMAAVVLCTVLYNRTKGKG